MGNAVKKKDVAKYEDFLQQGKSENVVKKAFERKYKAKLKDKSDAAWESFLSDYYVKYPAKKKASKRGPEKDSEEDHLRSDESDSESESTWHHWHDHLQKVLAEINSSKLDYRRRIVEVHQEEISRLGSQEKWTINYKLKGSRQKRFKQNSPRANTRCFWMSELMDTNLGDGGIGGGVLETDELPIPNANFGVTEFDANTPMNYDDLDEAATYGSAVDRSKFVTRESLMSAHSLHSFPSAHSLHSLPIGSDTASLASGMSGASYMTQSQSLHQVIGPDGRISMIAVPNQQVFAPGTQVVFVQQAVPNSYVTQPQVYIQQQGAVNHNQVQLQQKRGPE